MIKASNEQANEIALKQRFLDRATKLPEVFRCLQVTLLIGDTVAFGVRAEAEIFQAAYGDPGGRKYWEAHLSEAIPVYALAQSRGCRYFALSAFRNRQPAHRGSRNRGNDKSRRPTAGSRHRCTQAYQHLRPRACWGNSARSRRTGSPIRLRSFQRASYVSRMGDCRRRSCARTTELDQWSIKFSLRPAQRQLNVAGGRAVAHDCYRF